MTTDLERAEREIQRLQGIIYENRVSAWISARGGEFTTADLNEWEDRLRASFPMPPYCCDLHNMHCEPPSELCCDECGEARHPDHPAGVRCVLEIARDRKSATTVHLPEDR